MKTLRIGIVRYTNSLPYVWALEELRGQGMAIDITYDVPAVLAGNDSQGMYDLCLLPVGAMPHIETASLRAFPWGIACEGEVLSVCLFSNSELPHIHTIYTDKESRSSNLLMQLIHHHYLHQNMVFLSSTASSPLKLGEGIIGIGDKAFVYQRQFAYRYDLGQLWMRYTGLPFVFAHWIFRQDTDPHALHTIARQFSNTTQHLGAYLAKHEELSPSLQHYLSTSIRYAITDRMYEGMEKFATLKKAIHH